MLALFPFSSLADGLRRPEWLGPVTLFRLLFLCSILTLIRLTGHYTTLIAISMGHILILVHLPDSDMSSSVALLRLRLNLRPRAPPILGKGHLQALGIGLVLSEPILRDYWPCPGYHPEICPAWVCGLSPLQAFAFLSPNPCGRDASDHWLYVTLYSQRHLTLRRDLANC
jgi:hypothetical protein